MRKAIVSLFIFCMAAGLGALNCAAEGLADAVDAPPTPSKAIEKNVESGVVQDPTASAIQPLPLHQRIAQLMIVSMEGGKAPQTEDRKMLMRYTPGGVILPSIMRPQVVADYVLSLRKLPIELAGTIPLFIGVNMHELPKYGFGDDNFFPPLPSFLALAAARDEQATTSLASMIAEQLGTMGFNLYLGPSLTLAPVLPDAKGTIHCLGSDPEFAAQAGCTIIGEVEKAGIISMPMGFPGGGLNRARKGSAMLFTPEDQLRQVDLLPFEKAIEAGVSMIHVANTSVPTIDPSGNPASVSPLVIQDLLREELGFEGIVVAGPMDAPDMGGGTNAVAVAKAALGAGADMLLWHSGGLRVMRVVDELAAAVDRGELSPDLIDAALERVLRVKLEKGLVGRPLPKPKESERIQKRKEFPRGAHEIERRAITLVQNRNNLLPLPKKKKGMNVGVTGVAGVEELQEALSEHLKHVGQIAIKSARHGGRIYDFEIERLIRRVNGGGTVICVLTDDIEISTQVELVTALKQKGAHVVVVILGYPSTLPKLGVADAILLSYCDPDAADESMRAVAEALVGEAPIGILEAVRDAHAEVGVPEEMSVFDVIRTPAGRLPVSLDGSYQVGFSVPYDASAILKKVVWDFGDGTSSKDSVVEKTYETPGRYPVLLTVTAKDGTVTEGTFHIAVE